MDSRLILLPALVMVALTFTVMARMYTTRVAQMRRESIHPQAVATSARSSALLTDSAAADNFRNLLELPVLFYLALVVAAISGQVNAVTLALAWLFVALRLGHSVVHCTYNKVMHRMRWFMAGALVLLSLWAVLAYGLLVR